jgi:hypothetical protein
MLFEHTQNWRFVLYFADLCCIALRGVMWEVSSGLLRATAPYV